MECLAKIHLKYCNCIQYYMPRPNNDVIFIVFTDFLIFKFHQIINHFQVTICGRLEMPCIRNITSSIQMQSPVNDSLACNCLSGCFEILYDAEVSMAPLLSNDALLKNRKLKPENVSIMHIFYKNNYFRSQSKDEIIGFTEFLCIFFNFEFEFHLMLDNHNLLVFFSHCS